MTRAAAARGAGRGAAHARDGHSSVEDAIAARYDRLRGGQRRVIDVLLSDTRYGAVVSAADLAQQAGVSQSTVTRAAQTLGFDGYPDLQARLRRSFVGAGSVPERLAASAVELRESPELAGLQVMLEDAANVKATAEDVGAERLRAAIDLLIDAERVFVFGSRSSTGLALVLAMGLRLALPDARQLGQAAGDLADQLLELRKTDAVVGISFRRADRVTVRVLEHAARIGAPTIAITDRLSSPIARSAKLALIARIGPLRLMPSYAAGASLVNALITAISLRTRKAARARLKTAERLWQHFDTYAEE